MELPHKYLPQLELFQLDKRLNSFSITFPSHKYHECHCTNIFLDVIREHSKSWTAQSDTDCCSFCVRCSWLIVLCVRPWKKDWKQFVI